MKAILIFFVVTSFTLAEAVAVNLPQYKMNKEDVMRLAEQYLTVDDLNLLFRRKWRNLAVQNLNRQVERFLKSKLDKTDDLGTQYLQESLFVMTYQGLGVSPNDPLASDNYFVLLRGLFKRVNEPIDSDGGLGDYLEPLTVVSVYNTTGFPQLKLATDKIFSETIASQRSDGSWPCLVSDESQAVRMGEVWATFWQVLLLTRFQNTNDAKVINKALDQAADYFSRLLTEEGQVLVDGQKSEVLGLIATTGLCIAGGENYPEKIGRWVTEIEASLSTDENLGFKLNMELTDKERRLLDTYGFYQPFFEGLLLFYGTDQNLWRKWQLKVQNRLYKGQFDVWFRGERDKIGQWFDVKRSDEVSTVLANFYQSQLLSLDDGALFFMDDLTQFRRFQKGPADDELVMPLDF